MEMPYILGQGLGIIALFIGITVFLQKDDLRLKYRLAIYTLVMSAHFFLLGAYSAGISAGLNGTRTLVSIRYPRIIFMYLFMALTLLFAGAQVSTAIELLPIIGTLLSTYALFKLDGIKMRCFMLCSTACWVIYNISLGTIGGIIIESIFLVINGSTTYRIFKTQRETKKTLK